MRGRRKAKAAVAVFMVMAALVLLCVGMLCAEERAKGQVAQEAYEPLHQWGNRLEMTDGAYFQRRRVTTVLLMGVDRAAVEQTSGYRDGGQADFLSLLLIDDDRKRVTLLEIDRDTMVPVTVIGALGGYAGARTMQLSLAHGFGTGEQCCELTREAVSRLLLGTQIDFYMALYMDGIAVLNDLAGGVTVTLEEDFSEMDSVMTKGATITLTGNQAALYVHGRLGVGDETNKERMTRQRQYLLVLMERLDERLRKDKRFAEELYDALAPYLVTDMSRGRLINEVWSARSYERAAPVRPAGIYGMDEDGFTAFYADEGTLCRTVLGLLYEKAD